MSKLVTISILIAIIAAGIYYSLFLKPPPPLPEFDLNYWWGPEGDRQAPDTSIKTFKVVFSEEMISDLRQRLSSRRTLTPSLEGAGCRYGIHNAALTPALEYWRNKYDFKTREKFLNQYPQFKTNIQGLNIHFLHIKPSADASKGSKVLPLLLLHGWPGSVREFYEAIPYITKYGKEQGLVFEFIVPSLPGYGFSSGAVRPGLGAAEMAVVMRNLMQRLGFKKYYIQGGDWGSIIGSQMSTIFPKEILGYHTNMPSSMTMTGSVLTVLGSFFPSLVVDANIAGRIYPLSNFFSYLLEESGYAHIQATKPDTIGTALNESPTSLAAYILEKFSTWTNPANREVDDAGLLKKFTMDQLLDNLMMYWTSQSITTSVRLYAETFSSKQFGLKLDEIPTSVPTAVLQTRHELTLTPEKILKLKYTNLVDYQLLDDGGHFVAFELPQIFAQKLVNSISKMEKVNK